MSFSRYPALATASVVIAISAIATPHRAKADDTTSRFAAVVSGLPGAIKVDTTGAPDSKSLLARRDAALAATTLSTAARDRAARGLRAFGALGANTPLSRIRIVAYTQNGKLAPSTIAARVVPSLQTRTTTQPITFKYIGFTAQQITDFSAFRDQVYPLMVSLYGQPLAVQQGKEVLIQNDPNAGDGIYELPPTGSTTSGGSISYFPETRFSDAVNLAINNYNLSRLMLIAFHGPDVIAFDAWERGFVDAAALICNYQSAPSATFDPSQLGVYLMPLYDLFNRPELGNPSFFTSSTSANLGFYRLGMAQSAWIKVWIENPNFFNQFNTAYGNAVAADPTVAGNTPALKTMAAAIVPQVEGLGFDDWYRRQYVLDTAVTTGEKLWLGLAPQTVQPAFDPRSTFFGIAQHYSTDSTGTETPLGGQGMAALLDENGNDITSDSAELFGDDSVQFNDFGEAELNAQNVSSDLLPIVGLTGTGTPDMARVTLRVDIGTTEATSLFPYGVIGDESAPSGFYGATLGANTGKLTIASNGVTDAAPTWQRGVFGTTSAYTSGPSVKTLFTSNAGTSAARIQQRNSAWAISGNTQQSIGVVLDTYPVNATYSGTLSTTSGSGNKLLMISLPCYPLQSDEAAVLGVNPATLLLARYRPNLSPTGFTSNGVTYGVTSDKNELYPNIGEPFAPGRAYWIKLNSATHMTVRGGAADTTKPFDVPLLGGWNQFGVPFNATFTVASMEVQNGTSAPVSYATALANGWIGAGIWRWNPSGGYSQVDTGTATNQQLLPFVGYFVYATQARGLRLVFDPALSRTTALTQRANTATDWKLPLTAGDGITSASGSFGVSPQTSGKSLLVPAANPPAPAPAITLSFLSSGNAALDAALSGNAAGWSDSLANALTPTTTWQFLVDGAAAKDTVHLGWGDPATLPTSLALTLVDLKTGLQVAMNRNGGALPSYSFVSDGTARAFCIEAVPPATILTDFTAQSLAQSRTVWFTATFNSAGKANLVIENPSGAVIRNLSPTRAVAAGVARCSWDGRDMRGQPAQSGTYLAVITAIDSLGRSTQRQVTFNLS